MEEADRGVCNCTPLSEYERFFQRKGNPPTYIYKGRGWGEGGNADLKMSSF